MYKNHNNEKNSPAPYLVGKKRNFTLNKDMRKWKSHFFFDHPLSCKEVSWCRRDSGTGGGAGEAA